MVETGFFIIERAETKFDGWSAKPNIRAVLVKNDSDCHWIPKFLEDNGLTLGHNEEFKTVTGLHQPEHVKAQLDELYNMLVADPQKKEALEWLVQGAYKTGFYFGNQEGRNDLYKRLGA